MFQRYSSVGGGISKLYTKNTSENLRVFMHLGDFSTGFDNSRITFLKILIEFHVHLLVLLAQIRDVDVFEFIFLSSLIFFKFESQCFALFRRYRTKRIQLT